jgi:hypothetical protein
MMTSPVTSRSIIGQEEIPDFAMSADFVDGAENKLNEDPNIADGTPVTENVDNLNVYKEDETARLSLKRSMANASMKK